MVLSRSLSSVDVSKQYWVVYVARITNDNVLGEG